MQEIKVLDKGYVKLTGTLLSEDDDQACAKALDEMVVETARVSYGSGLKGPEKDKKLLHYLLEHEHGTPFESAVFRFEVKLPIFCMRQWIRHRWASYNEISGRYTDEISEDFYVPEKFRAQDTKNRQGSTQIDIAHVNITETEGEKFYLDVKWLYEATLNQQQKAYKDLVRTGLAKELARGVLGTNFYTKFVWTVNARSLVNFFLLRCESHAQWEMQQYAFAVLEFFKQKMPWTYESMVKLFPSTFGEMQ
jgi:thymidylate synthase (FAD)